MRALRMACALRAQLDSARDKRTDPEAELSRIESELESVQGQHRQLELEKESAEKQLKELMARFKLRKVCAEAWRGGEGGLGRGWGRAEFLTRAPCASEWCRRCCIGAIGS